MKLVWNSLHPLAREGICQSAAVRLQVARQPWEALDLWLQCLLDDSLRRHSRGKLCLLADEFGRE